MEIEAVSGLVKQSFPSLNRLGNPLDPAANIHFLQLKIFLVRIIKSDAESPRQFVQSAQELGAVEIDHENAALGELPLGQANMH
jgi:hypothetical protein